MEQNKKAKIDAVIMEKIITAAVILPLDGNLVQTRMNSLISFFLPSDNLNFLNITKKYYFKYLNKDEFQKVFDLAQALCFRKKTSFETQQKINNFSTLLNNISDNAKFEEIYKVFSIQYIGLILIVSRYKSLILTLSNSRHGKTGSPYTD